MVKNSRHQEKKFRGKPHRDQKKSSKNSETSKKSEVLGRRELSDEISEKEKEDKDAQRRRNQLERIKRGGLGRKVLPNGRFLSKKM